MQIAGNSVITRIFTRITRRVSVQQKAHHTFCFTINPIDGFGQSQIRMIFIQTFTELRYRLP